MTVKESELSNILDTHFIMIKSKIVNDNDVEGELVYIGNGNDNNFKKWFDQDEPITPIFFSSEAAEDGVVYDE